MKLSAAGRAGGAPDAIELLDVGTAANGADARFFFSRAGRRRHFEFGAAMAALIAPGRRADGAGFPFFLLGLHIYIIEPALFN